MKYLSTLITITTLALGCASIQSIYDGYKEWKKEQPTEPTHPSEPSTPPATDALYSSFQWRYGGFNGANAVADGSVEIELVGISKNAISYRWKKDLSNWGIGRDNADALVCAFLRNDKGELIGGKFDWVSTSRTSRDFKHFTSYSGWNLNGIPNPTTLYFVVVEANGKRRSNIISGEWAR